MQPGMGYDVVPYGKNSRQCGKPRCVPYTIKMHRRKKLTKELPEILIKIVRLFIEKEKSMTTRRSFIKKCGLGAMALATPAVMSKCAAPKAKPNIVFILIDDLGWADIGCYGNKRHKTPNIDRLAAQGMRFTDAYAAAPVCSPTRASIHSGQYPARCGIIDFIPGHWRPYEKLTVPVNRTQHLPMDIPTIADMMQQAGYVTAHFGKWHLGWGEYGPEHRGFDVTTPPKKPSEKNPRPADFKEWLKSVDITENNPKDVDRLTRLSLEFMESNRDKPFFLYLSHHTVHIPLAAKPSTVAKYQEMEQPNEFIHPAYSAMVEEMDISVGQVMGKLDDLGLSDNTLVVYFSDNGGLVQDYLKIGPICTSNKPLRGEKGTVYEGGIREPLIVRWPGRVKPGQTCQTPVSSVDFYPTLLQVAGLEPPDGHVLDGVSLLPMLQQKKHDFQNRTLYWHYPVYHHAEPAGAVREGDWKLVENFETGAVELFNLKEDIGETHNLAAQMPEKATGLLEKLNTWRQSVGARLPRPNPDFDPERRKEWGTHPSRENA